MDAKTDNEESENSIENALLDSQYSVGRIVDDALNRIWMAAPDFVRWHMRNMENGCKLRIAMPEFCSKAWLDFIAVYRHDLHVQCNAGNIYYNGIPIIPGHENRIVCFFEDHALLEGEDTIARVEFIGK